LKELRLLISILLLSTGLIDVVAGWIMSRAEAGDIAMGDLVDVFLNQDVMFGVADNKLLKLIADPALPAAGIVVVAGDTCAFGPRELWSVESLVDFSFSAVI